MKLDQFLDWITEVEFSQHAFGDKDNAGNLKHLPRIINLINQGVEHLHTKFLIKKGVAYLCVDGCHTRFTICHKKDYIRTEDIPLRLIEILEVIACDGRAVRLNANHRYPPNEGVVEVFMPNYNILEFSNTCCGMFRINFRRNGEPIPNPMKIAQFDPSDYKLDLPSAYIDALLYYCCVRLFSTITPNEGYAGMYSPSTFYKAKLQDEYDRLSKLENHQLEGMGNYEQRFSETGLP